MASVSGIHPRGFSLLETLVVMALIAILVIVAAPRLLVPEPVHVRVPARQLAADLRWTQRLAITRRADYVLEFSPATPPFATYTVRAAAGSAEPDFPKQIPSGVTATGPALFTFHSNGRADAGGTVTLTLGTSTATVQVIASTGRVVVVMP
jgi:prepilin-type N-terminal cleavage/methylation domain-containing protein